MAEQENSKQDEITFWDIVQTLAAFVAVPVTLLYPVGFFALFAQFVNYYFMDLYTAWYAASLVNRMVAVEQGLTIFALALVASVLLSAWIASILNAHSRGRAPKSKGAQFAILTGISLLILILYSIYGRIVAQSWPSWLALRGRLSTECNEAKVAWHQLALWPDTLIPASLYLVGCLWGGWLMYRSYQSYRWRTEADVKADADNGTDANANADTDANSGTDANPADRRLGNTILTGVKEGWIVSGLAIAYLFSVMASVVLAYNTPAYMPYMTYGDTVIHQGAPKPTVNTFLSHMDGQWYFLHRIQTDTDDNPKTWKPPVYTVVALAEREVKYVRVRPSPPNAARVAPLLGKTKLGMDPPEKHPCKQGIS